MNMSLGADVSPDNVDVTDLLERCIRDHDGAARGELTQILHRVHVEVNLVRNSEPHMVLCPACQALDVEIVINVHVVGGAIAAAGSTSKRKSGDQIVVNGAKAPIEPGEFTMIRPALIISPNLRMISSFREKTTAVCPRPPAWFTSTQTLRASATDFARNTASTGNSFSTESGCSRPIP